nr:unnamed protein product [Digitaria exilis]
MAPWRGARTAFGVSGILSFTITRNCCCTYMGPRSSQYFELWPGIARLLVVFRGVYTETPPQTPGSGDGSGGERVLCMVGDAVLPVPCSNSAESPNRAKNHGDESNFKPPVVADGNILLVLRYPKTLTLTTRAVRGEMSSTSAKSDDAYFDTVRLVSQVAAEQVSDYQFQPDEAELDVVAGCDDHDGGDIEQQHLSSGAALCQIINQYAPYNYKQVMEVIPNMDCDGTYAFCSHVVGPFKTNRPDTTGATEDMAFTRSLIGLKCQATVGTDGTPAARVAAVFRYVPPWEDQPTAANRTGLSGMTLSAEGVWTASTGRVCMVACLGIGDGSEEEGCRHRVTLFVRTAFRMTRRANIVGKITTMDGSHAPLLFQRRVNPRLESFPETPRMSYVYTKVEQARELLRRGERNGFRDGVVGRSLLGYPNIAGDEEDDLVSLSNLADNLSLRFQRVEKLPFVPEWIEEQSFELQILSVGTLVGRYLPNLRVVLLLVRGSDY